MIIDKNKRFSQDIMNKKEIFPNKNMLMQINVFKCVYNYSESNSNSDSDSDSNSEFMNLDIFIFFISYLHSSK